MTENGTATQKVEDDDDGEGEGESLIRGYKEIMESVESLLRRLKPEGSENEGPFLKRVQRVGPGIAVRDLVFNDLLPLMDRLTRQGGSHVLLTEEICDELETIREEMQNQGRLMAGFFTGTIADLGATLARSVLEGSGDTESTKQIARRILSIIDSAPSFVTPSEATTSEAPAEGT